MMLLLLKHQIMTLPLQSNKKGAFFTDSFFGSSLLLEIIKLILWPYSKPAHSQVPDQFRVHILHTAPYRSGQ